MFDCIIKYLDTFIKEFDDAWRNWIVTFYNNEYVNLGELIEKLIVVEFIKLKTAFTPQDVYKSRITELQTVYNTYADSNPDKAKTDEAKKTDVSLFTDYLTGTFVENIKVFYGTSECTVAIKDFFDTESWYTKCKADITIDTPANARSSCLTGTGATPTAPTVDAISHVIADTATGANGNAATNGATTNGATADADAVTDGANGNGALGSDTTGANGNGALGSDTTGATADADAATNGTAPTAAPPTVDTGANGNGAPSEGGGKNKTIKHRRKTNKYTMRNYLRNKTTIKKNRHRYHNNTIKK